MGLLLIALASRPSKEPAPTPAASLRSIPQPQTIASRRSAEQKPIARVKVGGKSLESFMALKSTARAIRDLLEANGWQAFVLTSPLKGSDRNLIGIEVRGGDASLVTSVVDLLAQHRAFTDVRPVAEAVPRVSDAQHDIEVWIGESPSD